MKMYDVRISKMKRIKLHIIRLFVLLLFCGVVNEMWATKVTYHILTLPIDPSRYDYKMQAAFTGKRLEAFSVIDNNTSNIKLPDTYKSPLAKNFKYYYDGVNIVKTSAAQLYEYNTAIKSLSYTITDETANVSENTNIDPSIKNLDVYVTYEYDDSKDIKLDGSVKYNITMSGGFLALNRGRNNRLAVVPEDLVSADQLVSEDFVKVDVSSTKITPYYKSSNKESLVGSKFFFLFRYEGKDPYNIIISSAYDKDTTYIETHGGESERYKWYKDSHLFGKTNDNLFLASDDHKQYTTPYDKTLPNNPTAIASTPRAGHFHTMTTSVVYNTYALLTSTEGGYVYMVTRCVDSKGAISSPTDYKYYFLKHVDNNNLRFDKMTLGDASTSFSSDEEMYEIKDVNFKVVTPFGNTISESIKLSEYSLENDDIHNNDIPASLSRKYCNFTGKFYKDAALKHEITEYSQLDEGVYDVYVGYEVSNSIPFKAITPSDSYTAETWRKATWYELTDKDETTDKKIRWDEASSNFKNNGVSATYDKSSEYAFIGDPYELQVIHRSQTSGSTPYYLGSTLGISRTEDIVYGTNYEFYEHAAAQTMTFNVSGLKGNKKIKVTTGGTDASQITTISPDHSSVTAESSTSQTYNVTLAASGGTARAMTITIQEYDTDETTPLGSPTVITVHQSKAGYSWDIPADKTDGSMLLRKFNDEGHWYWDTEGNNQDISYSTESSTRMKVLTLPERDFTYNIVDKEGHIAVTATVKETIFSPLDGYANIPEVIRSPFLADETVTFYSSFDSGSGAGTGTSRKHLSSLITELTAGDPENSTNVYVKYTTIHLNEKSISISGDEISQQYNVKLNGSYIYYEGGVIKCNASPTTDQLATNPYLWYLRNRDPYAMLIDNIAARASSDTESVDIYDDDGNSTPQNKAKGGWVKVYEGTWGNDKSLVFTSTRTEASRFVAMMGGAIGVYEVLAATGDDTYYHIGRAEGTNTDTKIYSINTTGYAHGEDALRFELAGKETIFYHLIDKAGNEIFKDEIMSNNPRLALPADFVSPLVDTYTYYSTSALNVSITEIDNDTNESGEGDEKKDNHVYVTYTVNNLVKFNDTNSSYLLKFLHPFDGGYYLEDGNDKLTKTRLQAVYPYTNGDGSLNVYGTAMNEEQMGGGASTRSRWVWFFESKNEDPYHVMIHSSNTITYKDVKHPTYLQTHAVHFNQDTGDDENKLRVITGGMLPGIASITPTEYMILGTKGNYKLETTNKISDGVSEKRYTVTSLEQYWKTYNMIKQYLLEIDTKTGTYKDEFSNDESTWVVPAAKRTELKTKLESLQNTATSNENLTTKIGELPSKGIYYFRVGTDPESYTYQKVTVINTPALALDTDYTKEECQEKDWQGLNYVNGWFWHSYDAIANATRWNGYNDKSDGHEKKVVEKLEHWYQTFSLGDGSFDIETAIIPPVLILLDRHGWEIMRKPLPKKASYPYGDELDTLKVYDSPMVKEYKFYNNATKGTGCHKYTLRMQDGKERDQIKRPNGEHYTSESLAELPDINYSGVLSGDAIQDFYVTYTVKEEYENSYKYHLELHEEDSTYTESGTPSKFLMLHNGRYSRNEINNDRSFLSKPIHESSEPVGGNVYDMILSPQRQTVDKVSTQVDADGDGKIDDNNLWYVQPNLNIDLEMGIKWAEVKGASLEPHTEYEMKKEYKDKTGFDPYNIQLKNVSTGKFMTSHMTSTRLDYGVMVGNYSDSGGSTNITLENEFSSYAPTVDKGSEGYDHTNLQISNQTFMAVSDVNGNMQLMPRFDHKKRFNVSNLESENRHTTLKSSENHEKASVDNNSSMGPQTTFFVRPQVVEYHIIDNDGNEALIYKRAGDKEPTITEHFKSPLATDYKYYYDHATYTTSASSKASHTAAGTPNYFKKTATSDENMTNQAKLLEVLDDYYFKVTSDSYKYVKVNVTTGYVSAPTPKDAVYTVTTCSESDYDNHKDGTKVEDAIADDDALETAAKALTSTSNFYYKINTYDYKKVTVTEAYVASPKADATYTTADCTETDWTNAVASQQSEANEAAMQTAILSLGTKGLYYYQLGSGHYAYKEVVRAGGKNTIKISDASTYDGATNKNTATDEEDFETKAEALSVDGTYYYKLGPLYNYQKVVVTNTSGNILSEIAAKKDISDKEITGTLAEADLNGEWNHVYVRYSYNVNTDVDEILQGKWFTIKLHNKDVLADGILNPSDGTGVSLKQGSSKPSTIDANDEGWQWKFLVAPMDPESEYYEPADPYAIELFNREKNYSATLEEPNPMSVPIKINGTNRFALLSHPKGGYALAASGSGYAYKFLTGANMDTDVPATTYSENLQKITVADDEEYTTVKNGLSIDGEYYFKINGVVSYKKVTVSNNTPDEGSDCAKSAWDVASGNNKLTATNADFETKRAALSTNGDYYFRITTSSISYKKVTIISGEKTEVESNSSQWEAGDTYHFNIKSNALSDGTELILNNDVTHEYTYNVINNAGNIVVSSTQTSAVAETRNFAPYLPDEIQSHLLNLDDYKYYGNVTGSGPYTVVDQTKLHTLYGLYKDVVYVRYGEYNPDNTEYLVPNKRNTPGTTVARDPESQDVALNIKGELPYNIIWYSDNMMQSDGSTISGAGAKALDGNSNYVWLFEGEDPYALKIKHKSSGHYIYSSNNSTCTLDGSHATLFMLLKKDGYDSGVLQVSGGTKMLSGNGHILEASDETHPTKFIIFGLSTHKVIYHLVIAKSCPDHNNPETGEFVDIPYRKGDETTYQTSGTYNPVNDVKRIYGTTQRDLTSSIFGVPGDRYQAGSTIFGQTYCVDAGEVSIGDVLDVPSEFDRPNCVFFFYVDNVQTKDNTGTYQKGASNNITSMAQMESDVASLAAVGDYYYKITGQYIYRKVHVIEAKDGTKDAAYEISGSTEAAYTAAATSTAFQKTATSVSDMLSKAASLNILGEHYYNVNEGASYYRVTVHSLPINDVSDTTIVVCTKADYDNAVATKKTEEKANESAMIADANAIATVGDYYYKVGTLNLYKRVQVTEVSPSVKYTVVDCTEDDWNNCWQDNTTLNNKYKGLEITKLMSDADLIGGLVKINIAYAFQTGLETNAGEGFVTSVDQNLWYTFETAKGTTPYLAHYTNAWGLQAMAGRETRYTNDYLWTPLGDVYGFRMYNRYMIKNSGGVNNVMTMPTMTEGTNLKLAVPGVDGIPEGYEVFELLSPYIPSGSFKVHPVVNKVGTQYYIKRHDADTDVSGDGISDLNFAVLSTEDSEWTFSLTTELLKPYIDRVGYLGGLKTDVYNGEKKDVLDRVKAGTASYEDMLEVQGIVYKDVNIISFTPGYYRLHNQPGVSKISPVRYASGYLHDIEKTAGTSSTPIPMHFYSKKGVSTTFGSSGLKNGYTKTNATRGDIPVPPTENDPSTIFYIDGGINAEDPKDTHNPRVTMATQGLYVKGKAADENGSPDDHDHGDAVMTATPGEATTFSLMDIGGAVFLIHDGTLPATRRYLNFSQDYKKEIDETEVNMVYDLKYFHNSPTDDAKWCIVPADSLMVATNNGGDGYYYSTFCAPFDVQLPDDVVKDAVTTKAYYAYTCNTWNDKNLHPKKVDAVSGTPSYAAGKFVPAGTPVIFRIKDESGSMKLTLPSSSPSTKLSCVFSGKYLEQLLTPDESHDVYTLGLPFTTPVTINRTTGAITAELPEKANSGLGFYINATPNKENGELESLWLKNNNYVLHNKIYYRYDNKDTNDPVGAPVVSPQFVPVIFDDLEEQDEELNPNGAREIVGDGCIYDLMGRKVATREQVEDGSWKQRVATGIYILNGKKFQKK